MLDSVGDAICEFFGSFIPCRVWLAILLTAGFFALLFVLLGQPG